MTTAQSVALDRMMRWAPLEQYEPTLSTTGTQPSGQTVTGRFRRDGALAYVSGVATLGAGLGTGEYRISLPAGWTAATVAGMFWRGDATLLDVGVATYDVKTYVASSTALIGFLYRGTTAQFASVTSGAPISLGSGDQLSWSIWLEVDGS